MKSEVAVTRIIFWNKFNACATWNSVWKCFKLFPDLALFSCWCCLIKIAIETCFGLSQTNVLSAAMEQKSAFNLSISRSSSLSFCNDQLLNWFRNGIYSFETNWNYLWRNAKSRLHCNWIRLDDFSFTFPLIILYQFNCLIFSRQFDRSC